MLESSVGFDVAYPFLLCPAGTAFQRQDLTDERYSRANLGKLNGRRTLGVFYLHLSALSDVTYTMTVPPSMASPLLCHGSIGIP